MPSRQPADKKTDDEADNTTDNVEKQTLPQDKEKTSPSVKRPVLENVKRDTVIIATIWAVSTLVLEVLFTFVDPFPIKAAHQAEVSDDSFRILTHMGLPVITFTLTVLGYSIARYRCPTFPLEDGPPLRQNTQVSTIWLGITSVLCFVSVIYPGLTELAEFRGDPVSDLRVDVTGLQFSWIVHYPDTDKTSTDLVLPKGRQVELFTTSNDVVHSLWIPAFRTKIDAVPGRTNSMKITPIKTGSYKEDPLFRVQCAELCGLNHTLMKIPVRVLEPDEFDKWLIDN